MVLKPTPPKCTLQGHYTCQSDQPTSCEIYEISFKMGLVLKPSLDFYVALMPLKIPHPLDAHGLLVTNVLEDWTTPIDLEASPLFPRTFHAFPKSKIHVSMVLNMFPKIELHSHSA